MVDFLNLYTIRYFETTSLRNFCLVMQTKMPLQKRHFLFSYKPKMGITT